MDTNAVKKTYGIGELLGMALERAVPLFRGIPDAALGAATPCAEYDVKALVIHVFQVIVQFQRLAVKEPSDFGEVTPDRVAEGPDWRERLAREADRLVAAWSAPGAEEGTTGAMDMPARLVGSMALLDLTVHVWDLARATGQEYGPADSAVVEELTAAVAQLAPTARSMGVFGEPVPVTEDASAFERLLAGTGRDPRWGVRCGGAGLWRVAGLGARGLGVVARSGAGRRLGGVWDEGAAAGCVN